MTDIARILTEAADAAQATVRCQTHAEGNGKQNTIDFLRQLAAEAAPTRNPSVVTNRVLSEVLAERVVQDTKWGEQNHPDGTGGLHYAAMADEARSMCEHVAKGREGGPRWALILLEEAYEALTEADPARLRAELIQVAAVAVAWVEAIDRRPSPIGLDDVPASA